ncbi:MAG: hypothetical protein RLY64_1107 [Bacteroidota bacterium]
MPKHLIFRGVLKLVENLLTFFLGKHFETKI